MPSDACHSIDAHHISAAAEALVRDKKFTCRDWQILSGSSCSVGSCSASGTAELLHHCRAAVGKIAGHLVCRPAALEGSPCDLRQKTSRFQSAEVLGISANGATRLGFRNAAPRRCRDLAQALKVLQKILSFSSSDQRRRRPVSTT